MSYISIASSTICVLLFIVVLGSTALGNHTDRTLQCALHQRTSSVEAAQELETVRDIVLVQQNRSLPSVADVVVFDPYHGANGFALPSTDNNSHVNTLFIPDLSMAGLRGSHYQQFGTGVTWRANRP